MWDTVESCTQHQRERRRMTQWVMDLHSESEIHPSFEVQRQLQMTYSDYQYLKRQKLSMSNIKACFAKYGIHPFDPDTIDKSKILPSLQFLHRWVYSNCFKHNARSKGVLTTRAKSRFEMTKSLLANDKALLKCDFGDMKHPVVEGYVWCGVEDKIERSHSILILKKNLFHPGHKQLAINPSRFALCIQRIIGTVKLAGNDLAKIIVGGRATPAAEAPQRRVMCSEVPLDWAYTMLRVLAGSHLLARGVEGQLSTTSLVSAFALLHSRLSAVRSVSSGGCKRKFLHQCFPGPVSSLKRPCVWEWSNIAQAKPLAIFDRYQKKACALLHSMRMRIKL